MKRSVRTYDEIGDLITWFNQYIKDLQDKKYTEEKLAESISQQTLLVNGISEAILQLSYNGKILFLNPAWRNISGYRVDESIGIEFVSYVTGDDKKRFQNTFNDLLIGKHKNYTENIRLDKKDESLVWVKIRFSVMRNNNDVFIVGVLSDVSESVEINNMKDEFVNTVSHELRTPLTAIKESLNLVMSPETGSLSEMHESLLNITSRNIDRLAGLVNNVLQYQKFQHETMKMPMNLENINKIIEESMCLIIPMANKKGIQLEAEMEHALPNVMCNKDSITQLLFNLINNSIKFTQKGSIKIKSAVKDTFIIVTVTDTGIGIKKEDQKKLFSTFSQVKNRSNANPGSSGLGLAICRKIVHRHSGNIWVESDFGKGSVFSFTLPLTEFNLKLSDRKNQYI
jgi:PAS domain S-box-containing protein